MNEKILQVKDLVVKFNLRGKVLTAIRNVSLDLYENEILAIVGESGSGKSVLTKTFIGMTDKNGSIESGSINFKGLELEKFKTEKDWLKIRGKRIAMVFQDPMTALNPLKKVGEQIQEVLELHSGLSKEDAIKQAKELMNQVGIPDVEKRFYQYSYEFSGGMRQRIVIACAMACRPEILICDEPTTALDVTLQAQILQLLKDLQTHYKMAVIFITHDLGVVANIADRVAVMYAGEIAEYGKSEEIFSMPVHPYTKALLKSLPQLGIKGEELFSIKGTPPSLFKTITGDAFAPRNPDAMKIDFEAEPPYYQISPTHFAKTWTMNEIAIKRYGDPRVPLKSTENFMSKTKETLSKHDEKKPKEKLVTVNNLSISFGSGKKLFNAVKNVSFDIYRGETFSLVGESGSGKTTIGRAIMKIIPTDSGDIIYRNKKINAKMTREEIKEYRQQVQMIFQDPMASLNERAKVDYIISEGLYNFKLFKDENERKNKVENVMREVGLSPEYATRFPHEFSGGQRQRLGIARALIMQPEFIIADEPISALDVSIRAQIINLLNKLKTKNDLTYMFIAHDLSVVRFISDRIAVIHKGQIVELADSEELFEFPIHPYTRALLSAIPMPDPQYEKNKKLIIYDEKQHNYQTDKPEWVEIKKGHYIWANNEELNKYDKEIKKT